MAGRLRARLLPLLVIVALAASCGGGGDDDGVATRSGDGNGSSEAKATLGIITTSIETALGTRAFAEASEGQQLGVGDRVRTDETGFAEITYQDGSWQRVENRATLTVLALTARGSVDRVRTGIDVGRTWNRVQELDDPEDEYEVQTPVGTAAVRGTVFATDCTTEERCTFTVLEGTVRVTPVDGDPVDLQAGESLEVTDGEAPAEPSAADPNDPWIVKNQTLDAERTGSEPGETQARGRGIFVSACDALSPEEADELASQRDDGRAVTGMEQSNAYSGGEAPSEGWVSSQCSWSAPGNMTLDEDFLDAGRIQLDLAIGRDLRSCGFDGEIEPPPGGETVTDGFAGRWYPDRRMLIAFADETCVVLRHSSTDAGTAGRDVFAEVVRRILTRVDQQDSDLDPNPQRNMTTGSSQSPTSVVMGM